MGKKLFFIIFLMLVIGFASFFGVSITPKTPLYNLGNKEHVALFVCSPKSNLDELALSLKSVEKYINIGLFFIISLLLMLWLWALYQNLLKDNFKKDVYKNPWELTKFVFIVYIIILIILNTPNYYRNVYIGDKQYVLCDNNTKGAIPVHFKKVKHNK